MKGETSKKNQEDMSHPPSPLRKVNCLALKLEQAPVSKPQSTFLPSESSSPGAAVSLHFFFEEVIRDEWNKHDKGKHINTIYLRLYIIKNQKALLLRY